MIYNQILDQETQFLITNNILFFFLKNFILLVQEQISLFRIPIKQYKFLTWVDFENLRLIFCLKKTTKIRALLEFFKYISTVYLESMLHEKKILEWDINYFKFYARGQWLVDLIQVHRWTVHLLFLFESYILSVELDPLVIDQ